MKLLEIIFNKILNIIRPKPEIINEPLNSLDIGIENERKFKHGKYINKTVRWVEHIDPEYIIWYYENIMYQNTIFESDYKRILKLLERND